MELGQGGGNRTARVPGRSLGVGLALAAALSAAQARASEGGISFYPLGIGVPDAAIMPPVQGVYYANVLYNYSGQRSRE